MTYRLKDILQEASENHKNKGYACESELVLRSFGTLSINVK